MDGLREALAKAVADILVSFAADVFKNVANHIPREIDDQNAFNLPREVDDHDEFDSEPQQDSYIDAFDSSLDRQTDVRGNACVICLCNEKCCYTSPCMHLCICLNCANNLITLGDDTCPICRIKIRKIGRVYV